MGKLHDLLYAIIDRVNKSVKTTVQSLSESEKTQARANIGAMPSTYVPPNQTAQQVGADPKGTAAAAVSAHNTNTAAHADIRNLITGLADRLNALANSDDTTLDQMKEVVDYIQDNRELIESVTTNKVNVADIVDNLATADAKKPLSAKQGVELLNLINSSSGSGGGSGVNLDSAEVGQLIVVESVDADGKPVKWKAVDRTHYKETIGEDAEVISQRYIDFTGSTATLTGLGANIFQDGHTYKVNWNGTEYTCKAYLSDGIVHLGNGSLAGAPVTTAEPFCIVGAGITCMVFKDTETAQSVKFKVDSVAEVVYHQIDPKYIKDMYYTESGRVEVLPETSFTVPESADGMYTLDAAVPFEVGKTYIVNWNGTEYTCSGQDASILEAGAVAVGNLSYQGLSGNGEPFALACIPGQVGTMVMCINTNGAPMSGEFTVSIYQDGEVVHKLDPKYLPDGVPYCIDGGMVEILPETTIATEEDMVALPSLGLMAGNDYVVRINGTEYNCPAFNLNLDGLTGVALGNTLVIGGEDNGLPFVVADLSPEAAAQAGLYVIIQPITEELTFPLAVSIYGEAVQIRKLDNRCLDMDYLGAVLGSSAVTLNLVELGMGTASYGAPAQLQQGLRDYVGKIVGGAKVRLIFKYNIGNNEETYDGYVTDWKIDAKWYSAVARIPLGTMSGYFNFATIYMDTETSYTAVSIQRFAESAT